ncbi:amino acid adenylation domain-containing protein [Bradyrhizobium sp. AUGA SZCCT0274]|uniref:non-ribosomal peptide synthetase n=1 Tax=Bradyrhizobium sp. AUGA SZCCT0274 TaxID=2807670 RepID=UPI001BAC8054|nr:amino acid adenylation domain-containing protein [Bradyrhizobium sp. AUGA SZCCT0274]MBR1240319.1 amino acid adenylation domain-containing protein [Bradyrhizobium sp. AUGA SZCCT0274]
MTDTAIRQSGMSAAQQALLRRLLTGRDRDIGRNAHAIPRKESVRDIPLLPNQAGVWFQTRMFPESPEYNQIGTLRLDACQSEAELERMVHTLMNRHDALRLRIYEKAGEPLLEVCVDVPCPIRWYDASGLSREAAQKKLEEIGNRCYRAPFDLERAPLFRLDIIRMPGGGAVAFLVFHHIAVDGYSIEIVYRDVLALLAGDPLGPAPSVRFIDYVAFATSRGRAAGLEEQLVYWRHKLSGELPVLDIPSDRPRPKTPSRRGHVVPCEIPARILKDLQILAEAEKTTLFVTLLTVYNVVLMRLSGQTDILVGTVLSGRDHPAVETVVGMFVNTVALRSNLAGNPTFRDALRQVRTTVLEAHDHGDVPFGSLVAHLNLPRDPRVSPLFQTMFSLGGLPSSADGKLDTTTAFVDSEAAKWDLSLFLDARADGMGGSLEYSADLFDRATAARFVDIFLQLCAAFAGNPDLKIGKAPLLRDAEKTRILRDLEPYARPEHPYASLAQPFEAQARLSPEAVALIGEEGQRTYGELNAAANRLARDLMDMGARPGAFVAVCMEVSFALVTALFAVAKTGAAYVPLDPQLPPERINYLLDDTRPVLTLADQKTRSLLTEASCPVYLADATTAGRGRSGSDIACTAPPGRPVHLLYTSGSTGRPKGVIYSVEGAIAEILWLHSRYPLAAGGANLFKSSYGFDVSIWEIFWTLYFGAKLVVPRPGENCDPKRLIALIEQHKITQIFLVPGMLELILEVMPDGECTSLCCVLCGGASVSARLRDRFYEKLPDSLLVNCFGPTECGTVTDHPLANTPGLDHVPLGHPALNFTCYVLDLDGQLCPIGVPGELYIGGEIGLALGYHGRSGLTAEQFLPDPFGLPGQRMYRTGDLCRRWTDGTLEHLGRMDRQVKLRGVRVELSEIEAVLCEHDAVARCCVLVRDDPQTGPQIPAFVVLKEGAQASPEDLLAHARKLLPHPMVPPAVVAVDDFPTNVNGKIDTAALALRGWSETEDRRIVKAETFIETRLLEIFRRLLGVSKVGVTDSFFDLGGHSLLIFRLLDACETAFGQRPTIVDVFSGPTVRELAGRLSAGTSRRETCLVPLTTGPGRPLVVFIHGAGGSAMPFVELAKAMGTDLACYGLQAPDSSLERDVWTVEALAARYAAEVDAIRGPRPVVLAGWSMGGCVAIEMARAWAARGEDVSAVLLLDTWTPPSLLPAQDADEISALIEGLDILGLEGTDEAPEPHILGALQEVAARNCRAFNAYRPEALAIDVDYLSALEPFDSKTTQAVCILDRFREMGWRPLLRSLAQYRVEGSHFTMVDADHAPGLAAILREIIDTRLGGEEI